MAIEIKIGASFNDRDIKRAQRELDNLSRVADKMSQSVTAKMARTGESFSRLGQTLTTNLSLPLMAIGGLSIKAFTEQEDAIAKMEAVIKSTGGVAGVTSKHITDLSSSLQETTTFADEVTTNAAALLLTFKGVRNEMGEGNDVFDRTIRASQDLSALMGKDLNESVMMLGKALQDPETGLTKLTRAGVQFSDQQKDQIKTLAESGDILGAQKIMLAEIESQFGGTAEAMAQTAGGKLKQAFNDLGEAGEAIGAEIAPILADVAGFVADIIKKFSELPGPIKTAVTLVGGIVAALGPAIWGTGVMLTNLATIGKTKLGTAVIDGFSAMRTAMANFVGQSRTLTTVSTFIGGIASTLGMVAVGAGLAVAGIRMIQDAVADSELGEFAKDAKTVAAELTEFANTGQLKGTISNIDQFNNGLEATRRELLLSKASTNVFDDAVMFLGMTLDGTYSKADEFRDRFKNLDAALVDMNFETAQQTLENYFNAMGLAIPDVDTLRNILPDFTAKVEASKNISDPAAQAILGLGDAYEGTGSDIDAAREALEQWERKIRGHFDPVFAVIDANDELRDSNQQVADATRAIIDAEKNYGTQSPEAIAARNALKDADLAAVQAALDLKFANDNLRLSIENGGTSALTAAGMLEGLITNQGLSGEAADRVRQEFFNMISQINLTPSSVPITISTNVGQVLTDMATIAKGMDILGPGPWSLESAFRAATGLPALAAGGPVTAGMPHIVGERGRELFIPSTDGVIVPHHQSRRILSESAPATTGPQTTNNVVNVTVNKTDASPYEIGRELLWAMKVAG
jgi:hypothetical protein